VKSLKSKLKDKKLNLDEKTLKKIARAEADGVIVGTNLELLLRIRERHEQRGFLVEAERQMVRKIEKDYEDYPLWRQTYERLVALYNDGLLPPQSHGFVEDMVKWFDEHHKWTPLQFEQVATMIEQYDPEEETNGGGEPNPEP